MKRIALLSLSLLLGLSAMSSFAQSTKNVENVDVAIMSKMPDMNAPNLSFNSEINVNEKTYYKIDMALLSIQSKTFLANKDKFVINNYQMDIKDYIKKLAQNNKVSLISNNIMFTQNKQPSISAIDETLDYGHGPVDVGFSLVALPWETNDGFYLGLRATITDQIKNSGEVENQMYGNSIKMKQNQSVLVLLYSEKEGNGYKNTFLLVQPRKLNDTMNLASN
jgi:hypothetical protein